ncbi:unnamed protein product, partial [Tenebrio molitor]
CVSCQWRQTKRNLVLCADCSERKKLELFWEHKNSKKEPTYKRHYNEIGI